MPERSAIRMPRFGLAAKLAGCLIGGALVYSAWFAFFQQRLEQRHLEGLVSLSATRVADIIRNSARHAMLQNDREQLYAMIRDIGREPGIRLLRLINEQGLVRHSTAPREVGTMVDKSAEACYGCHAQRQPLSRLNRKDRMRIFVEPDGRRTLAIIQPIENAPDCSSASCHAHPEERQILGVIDVHLTLDAVDAQLAEHRAQMMGFTLFAALIVSLTGGGFIFLFVHRPVRELIYGTLRIGRGDLGHRIHVQSRDELGLLAASFNQMAEDLGQAYGQLKEWARRLEERVHDKTAELEKAHKGMIYSEKMASLGKLAATVAHEVNNPLFGMLTYARLTMKELAKLDLPAEGRDRILGYQAIIERESKRCGELMKGLLAFARQAPPLHAMTQLNTIVERARALVAHQYELAQIELQVALEPALPEISCDPDQVQQVLIILLANACDAVGHGGSVTVATRAMPGGDGIEFSVRDTGPGIAEELQTQIFEPFFSTKDDQHRTGLGLAVARGIVERHGGTITVESRPGEGAEFLVHLPLSAAPEHLAATAKESA
ncbi:MAG: sensor histidine kinase [Bryobacteraceae bacterium]